MDLREFKYARPFRSEHESSGTLLNCPSEHGGKLGGSESRSAGGKMLESSAWGTTVVFGHIFSRTSKSKNKVGTLPYESMQGE
jgi:hypothetical protein